MPDEVIIKNPFLSLRFNIKPKGAYKNEIEYEVGDSVSYNGSSYVALQTTFGNLPTNDIYWQIMASKGEKGDPLSVPPEGYYKVTNLYVNPQNGKLVVAYDNGG